MTAQEVCEKYKVSETSLKSQFKRTQESIYKKFSVKIIKEGRGANVDYREVISSDRRAESMFQALEPIHDTGIMKNDLSMPSFTFCVFMGIITTPMLVFRGTYVDFLKYIEITVNNDNIEKLKESINSLIQSCIINCIIDITTDEEVVTLSLVRSAEVEMKIGINMIKTCRILSQKYHKRDWVPLLKVWLGTELLSKQDHYTRKELIDMTGLTKYQLDESARILKESNIYKSSKAYAGYQKCLGLSADMNIEEFYEIV